jgi:hypothetical protein
LVLLVGCGGGDDAGEILDTDGSSSTVGGGSEGWTETEWCGDMADLSDLEAAYDPSQLRSTLVSISERRYPPAVGFIDAQDDGDLAIWFTGSDSTFDDVMSRYEVAVHEGSHIWGFGEFDFDSYSYRVVDDSHIIRTARLDNFDRSAILDRHPDPAGDFYSSTYLEGSSGAQGFNTLLDEYNAYAHSLATQYCTRDRLGNGASTSARDGILTFMFYVGTYLAIAREEHPGDYEAILADSGHSDVILDVWDRAQYLLDLTADHPELGISDDQIAELAFDPDNVAEIDALR